MFLKSIVKDINNTENKKNKEIKDFHSSNTGSVQGKEVFHLSKYGNYKFPSFQKKKFWKSGRFEDKKFSVSQTLGTQKVCD